MAALKYLEDYHTSSDPKIYLEQFFGYLKEGGSDAWPIMVFYEALHEFWSNFKAPADTKVRYLEFGGGPSIAHIVIACPKVDHIVFAEYTEANRKAIKLWIAGDQVVYDWTPFIEMVTLKLERGHETVATDKEKLECVLNRAGELRDKIKSIVPCDITKTPIVQLEHEDVAKPFDVVFTNLCLEACVSSEVHYKNSVAELAKFLKPNGVLYISGVLGETFHYEGHEKYYSFPVSEKLVKEAMNEARIVIEKFVTVPRKKKTCKDIEVSDWEFIFYTFGRKIL